MSSPAERAGVWRLLISPGLGKTGCPQPWDLREAGGCTQGPRLSGARCLEIGKVSQAVSLRGTRV